MGPLQSVDDVTDEEWKLIEPFIPVPGFIAGNGGAKPKWCPRAKWNAVNYINRTGAQWRNLPLGYPKWQTVYSWHRDLEKEGVLDEIRADANRRARIAMEKDPYPSLLLLDSKSVRADEGVPKATKGKDAYKKVIGRKFHLATDTEGLIHLSEVTPANVPDDKVALDFYETIDRDSDGRFSRVEKVKVDNAYHRYVVDDWFEEGRRHFAQEVVSKPPNTPGFEPIRQRWVVERTNAWVPTHRRISVCHEKKLEMQRAFLSMAAIDIAIRRIIKVTNGICPSARAA
jgi:transposase